MKVALLLFILSLALSGTAVLVAEPPEVVGIGELMRIPGIERELGIDDEQKFDVTKAMGDRKSATAEFGRKIFRATVADRAKIVEDFQKGTAKSDADLLAVLSPSQRHRLMQVRMQMLAKGDGITFGLKNPEFLKSLRLTETQDVLIDAKAAELKKSLDEKVKRLNAEIEKATRDARDEMISVLTADQRAKYLELVGLPFAAEK